MLILAGDIVPFSQHGLMDKLLKILTKNFKKVIWVPGNHEYYTSKKKSTITELLQPARDTTAKYGATILDNETLDIGDVRIIGSTLWSHIPEERAA